MENKYQILAKNFEKVTPYIYRGGLPSEGDLEYFKFLGIKTVIDFNRTKHEKERKIVESLGMTYVNIPWLAYWHFSSFLKNYYKAAAKFLDVMKDHHDLPVYIHCFHGRERTGVMIAIYRMVYDEWSFGEVLQEMKKFGFVPWLHLDLVLFLLQYKKKYIDNGQS